jgi:hypothetical protein
MREARTALGANRNITESPGVVGHGQFTDPVIRAKVEDYLRTSSALEFYWQRPITNRELQAEMERMARSTKQPDALRELWAALNDDPLLITECLARPILAERLIRELYMADEHFHGELKRRAKSELNELGATGQMRRTSGEYREVDWIKDETEAAAHSQGLEINGVSRVSATKWDEQLSKLAGKFGATRAKAELPTKQWSGCVPSAQIFRIRADGAQSYEPVAEYNAAQQRFIPLPIDLGPETDQVFLVLYGTGIRFRSSRSAVTVNIGGVNTEVLFAGASPDFVGVDQVNLRLPRSMIGRGEVNVTLTVDGKTANTVKVAVK